MVSLCLVYFRFFGIRGFGCSSTSPGLGNLLSLFFKINFSAEGWYSGMTQRDGMGREVGGGFRMGNTCKSKADSCQCMAKTTTIL